VLTGAANDETVGHLWRIPVGCVTSSSALVNGLGVAALGPPEPDRRGPPPAPRPTAAATRQAKVTSSSPQ
jgi:hypothetical protein